MNKIHIPVIGILFLFLCGCRYQNAVDLFYQGGDNKPVSSNGLLAHITFEKAIKDISENKTPVALQGDADYVTGVDGKDSSAIHLDGFPQCISITNLGSNDTLSIFMWFKADNILAKNDSFTLFDYGVNSFSLQIDGSTGATLISTSQNDQKNTIPDYINSFYAWNYLYAEAGGGKMRVMYQGQKKDKQLITIDSEKESTGILEPLTDILYIGRSATSKPANSSYFKGSIDNIRVFKRPLTNAEVLSLINEDTTN
jgi:hypothetical protein